MCLKHLERISKIIFDLLSVHFGVKSFKTRRRILICLLVFHDFSLKISVKASESYF